MNLITIQRRGRAAAASSVYQCKGVKKNTDELVMHAERSLAHYDQGKLGVTSRDLVKTAPHPAPDQQRVQLRPVTSSLNNLNGLEKWATVIHRCGS